MNINTYARVQPLLNLVPPVTGYLSGLYAPLHLPANPSGVHMSFPRASDTVPTPGL